jgi:hypothetical protein
MDNNTFMLYIDFVKIGMTDIVNTVLLPLLLLLYVYHSIPIITHSSLIPSQIPILPIYHLIQSHSFLVSSLHNTITGGI